MELWNCGKCGEIYYEPEFDGEKYICPCCGTAHDRSESLNEDMIVEMLEGYRLKLGFVLTNAKHGMGRYEYNLTRKE